MIGATGFAVAPEILSTSLHVMTLDPEIMRAAQGVAITEDGKVYPVTEIIAASDRSDTCLIRVPGLNLPPLSIRGGALPGEPVWCMSHPDGFTYMFTSGQVARVSRDHYDEKHQPALHLEVTAEYCPGSSGGAMTDAAGNVLAQVSSINNYDGFTSHDGKAINGIVSARTCTAAEEILALAKPGENEPVPLPTPLPGKKHRAPKPQATPAASASPSPRSNSR
jgi:S1-C subfamily serine protease